MDDLFSRIANINGDSPLEEKEMSERERYEDEDRR